MLVLSRKSHESVVVGGSADWARLLKITVLEITGNRVSLGFEGDADIPVSRLEVWARRNVSGPVKKPPQASPAPPEEAAHWADVKRAETSEPPANQS